MPSRPSFNSNTLLHLLNITLTSHQYSLLMSNSPLPVHLPIYLYHFLYPPSSPSPSPTSCLHSNAFPSFNTQIAVMELVLLCIDVFISRHLWVKSRFLYHVSRKNPLPCSFIIQFWVSTSGTRFTRRSPFSACFRNNLTTSVSRNINRYNGSCFFSRKGPKLHEDNHSEHHPGECPGPPDTEGFQGDDDVGGDRPCSSKLRGKNCKLD